MPHLETVRKLKIASIKRQMSTEISRLVDARIREFQAQMSATRSQRRIDSALDRLALMAEEDSAEDSDAWRDRRDRIRAQQEDEVAYVNDMEEWPFRG